MSTILTDDEIERHIGYRLPAGAMNLLLGLIAEREAAVLGKLREQEPAQEVRRQALDALNRMQSITGMPDGRHPRDVLRTFIQLSPIYAASQPAVVPRLTGIQMAAIGREHFGNPIPQQWYAACRAALEAAGSLPAEVQVPQAFADWLCREMPPGTVISDPAWWAPRIARAMLAAAPEAPAPRKEVGDSRFESWFSEDFDPKNKGTKQQMREAYEAGMLAAAPEAPAQCHKRRNDACVCSRIAMLCDGVGPPAAPEAPAQEHYEKLEREHFGDPDKRTGIYAAIARIDALNPNT